MSFSLSSLSVVADKGSSSSSFSTLTHYEKSVECYAYLQLHGGLLYQKDPPDSISISNW